jgi:prepilin-type N-terminal cleavage/methylation domain-containing protein
MPCLGLKMNNRKDNNSEKNRGFTLIELSIVLVIIGLIVGGVLVGQDLIKAAELRATISQKEKFDAAVNTFRSKFNGVPGDLATYARFTGQLTTAGLTGGTGFGDGNGLIQGVGGVGTDNVGFVGEIKLFWRQLSDAALLGDNTASVTTAAAATIASVNGNGYVPPGKLGKGSFWYVGSTVGLNYYTLSGFTTMATATSMNAVSTDVITPNEAYQIDQKLDDGIPNTGTVMSIASVTTMTTVAAAGGATTGDCWDTDTNLYSTATSTEVNAQTCTIRMRTSF